MSLLAEPCLTSAAFDSISGLTFEVNRPAKHPDNPVYTAPASGVYHHSVYVTAVREASGDPVKLYLTDFASDWASAKVTLAESDDGATSWSRPNLGLVSYGGNTNNAILLDSGYKVFGWVTYEPTLTATPYIMTAFYWGAGPAATFTWRIYTASDPRGPFTLVNTLGSFGGPGGHDPWSIVRRSDGRWLVTYQTYPTAQRRGVGAWLSATSSITSTFTDLGQLTGLGATSTAIQNYQGTAWRYGDALLMAVELFNGDNQDVYPYGQPAALDDRQYKVELWASRADDGLTWTRLDADWLWAGSGINDLSYGEWDWGCIKGVGAPIEDGNSLAFYYSGSSEVHHPLDGQDAFVHQHRIGRADVDLNRIGGLTGTGTAITDVVNAADAAALTINSVGTVEVELLDAAGTVITGYSRADCDTIPADTFEHTVTWGGSRITPDEFKVKLYLTSATVHYITAEEADSLTAEGYGASTSAGYGEATSYNTTGTIAIDPASTAWEQVDTSIIVRTTSDASTVEATVFSPGGGLVRFRGTDSASFAVRLEGGSFAPHVDVPAGESTVYLQVTPGDPGTTLEAEIGIPI